MLHGSDDRRVFVGRERETQVLRGGVDDAVAGRGRLILLAGEPGIGKTRTCEEVATYAGERGAQVLWGRCSEDAGAPAFWPWVQILRACTDALDPDALRRALGDGAADIAQLVPAIREQLPDLPPAAGIDSSQARFRLFDTIARLLEQLARRAPLVVILDDLHGADHPSLLLVQFVVRAMRDVPLLVVGAYRDVALTREHPLTEMIVEALRAPGTERLQLSGLSQSEVERFIEVTVAVKPSAAVVAAIHRQTEGNPLFVAEYVRLLLADPTQSGLQTAAALAIPPSVKAVIGRRLVPLSRECNAVLDIASVIGREFGLDVLEAAAVDAGGNHVASPPLEKGELADLLAEAVDARVLVEVLGPSRRYRFAHALIRETLYDELSSSRRMELHRYVGEAIEQLSRVEDHLAELAHHFAAADHNKAVAYARRAGNRAMAVLAYEEAIRLYRLAVTVIEGAPAQNQAERCAVLVDLGVAQNVAGDLETSKATLDQAAGIAERLGLREELARAALYYGSRLLWGEAPAPDAQLVRLLERAASAWGEVQSPLHARVLARLGIALRFSDQHERRFATSTTSLEMARSLGDPAVIAYALNAWHTAHWRPHNLSERLAVAAELVQLAEQVQDFELAFDGHLWRFDDLFEVGDGPAAEVELVACEGIATRLRQPHHRWCSQIARVMLLTLQGQFAAAERLAQETLAVGQSVNSGADILFGLQMFILACTQGRRETFAVLAESFGELARQFPAFPLYRCTVAYILRELGQTAEARAEFEQLSAKGFRDIPEDQTRFHYLWQLSEVCAFLGDIDHAETLVTLLAPFETRALNVIGGGAYFGPAAHSLGLIETTLSRWDEATQHFEYALDMNRRMRARPWLARTQYEYAAMLLSRGRAKDRPRAQELAAAALSTARDLDMPILIERADALRERSQSSVAAVSVVDGAGSGDGSRAAAPRIDDPEPAVFRKEGDYWTIACDGTVLRLKNAKGLQYIAQLLRHPGQEILALDLIQGLGDNGREASGARSRGHGPALDAEAKAAYKRRLNDLREELDEAEGANDLGRATRARAEIEALRERLAAAVGWGGRDRDAASAAERARSTVTKGIKSAIDKIRAGNPSLARQLANAIRTGYLCTYAPNPAAIVSWQF